jgi:predicted CXXCH cytochrome family protein
LIIRARHHQHYRRWVTAGGIVLLLFLALAAGATAAPLHDGTVPSGASAPKVDNSQCLGCHKNPGLSTTLASGETLPLTVDETVFHASVHGQQNMACVSCHTNISGYPHPKVTAGDRRSFQLERYTQCQTCHPQQYSQTLDSNHGRALAAGNRQAAVCTDCHGAHDIGNPKEPRQKMAQTCQKCHSTIYQEYTDSVHGSALKTGNADVPVCEDCHGVHTQADPTTAAFRLSSPEICAKCHGDPALMQKYGISTDVMNTYVADFHGTTVTMFEKQSPDQASNKAVCIDCHGIHDMKKVTDADATVVKQNLLATCQKCHPDAKPNFPTSWVGHYKPSPTHYPLVYYVNLFYTILIPAVIGGMLLWVLLDGLRRLIDHFGHRGG